MSGPVRAALVVLATAVAAPLSSAAGPDAAGPDPTTSKAAAQEPAASDAEAWLERAAKAFDKLPLAPTPPMGWNSWNNFHCDINEDLIRETADAMVASGMREAGYEYVNIDDCWMAPERDADGNLQADPERFPSGIKALADYVHARGLKLGIYSSAGTETCQELPASLGHEYADARTFAEWGVDLLKYDNCHNQGVPAIERYTVMAEALAATGRDIVYSICEWGANQPWEWAGGLGHYWRTTGDISDTWGSMVGILDQQVGLEEFSGPNAWNDPDMLEVGNGGMTTREYRSHMSLWALLNAPLLAGNDLRDMDATTVDLLTNPDIVAINQDWAGTQGHKIADDGDAEVWAKPLSGGGAAVVLFNRGPVGAPVSTTAADLGLDDGAAYTLRDVWSGETTVTRGPVRASVPSHGSRTFVVEPGMANGRDPAVSLDVRTGSGSATGSGAASGAGFGTEGLVEAGQTFTTTVDVVNDGLSPVGEVDVTLSAPDGWTVQPKGPTRVRTVPPGKSATVSYAVTVPDDAPDDVAELPAGATYAVPGGDVRSDVPGFGSVAVTTAPRGAQWLSDLDPVAVDVGWGAMGVDESVDGNPITIGGVRYDKGIAPHAASRVTYYLGRRCTRFTADVGVDDETGAAGSVTFAVQADGAVLAETGVRTGSDPPQPVDVDVRGVHVLTLITGIGPDDDNSDHSDWAGARVECEGPSTSVDVSPAGPFDVAPGESVQISAMLTADGTVPATGVTFGPHPPAGWTVAGEPVQADELAPGDTLTGSWTVTVPDDAEYGPVELPVTATYRPPDDPNGPVLEDSAVLPLTIRPADLVAAREAESETNTIGGAAQVSGCAACSGEQKVGYLGNGAENDLVVEDVTVDTAGTYELILDYLVDGSRSLFVSVDGGPGVEVPLNGTSWGTPESASVPVELAAGANDIRLYNDDAYAPDVDLIRIAE